MYICSVAANNFHFGGMGGVDESILWLIFNPPSSGHGKFSGFH
jgi:hypothetical protein